MKLKKAKQGYLYLHTHEDGSGTMFLFNIYKEIVFVDGVPQIQITRLKDLIKKHRKERIPRKVKKKNIRDEFLFQRKLKLIGLL